MKNAAKPAIAGSLAIDGGTPVRSKVLPYGRQSISEADIAAVSDCLRSDWLTTGPKVTEFESAVARVAGVPHACAVTNGTAALHAALHAVGVKDGDEVIVPTMTFAATANAVLYNGAKPIFADVDPGTLLLTRAEAEKWLTPRTKAIVAVDYAGQPCDYDALSALCRERGIYLIADAAHSLGASYRGKPVGSLAHLTTLSFHPVKHITSGEGGMIVTADAELAAAARRFRNHGISTDHREREEKGSWSYEMVELGHNLRLSDIHCALGISQLTKLPEWILRRQEIARGYASALNGVTGLRPLSVSEGITHAYHLFVVLCDTERLTADRNTIYRALRAEGIGANVHYIPVHLHPYYRKELGTGPGMCPVAERAYEQILSLPLFPSMTARDTEDVIEAVRKVFHAYAR